MSRRRRWAQREPACPIALTATEGYDPAFAGRYRDPTCCNFTQCRVLLGITVAQLAAHTGVAPVHLHRIEAGEVRPNADGWALLDRALDQLSGGAA